MNKILDAYIKLNAELNENEKNKIPLCAAETYISNFCKRPLLSEFEGKYSFLDKNQNNSFVGGEYVARLNDLLSEECNILFGARYVNADTLTGINCFTVCAMSLLERNDYVLVTTPEQGGHASIPIILESLGVSYDSVPFNFENYQIDYDKTNELCSSGKYKFIVFCQSDVINPPNLNEIQLNNGMGIIYDGTQTLGLVAGQALPNPLNTDNVVLIGGTHKTLPAPSCGLIMTNNPHYAELLRNNITPNYLRNTQPNHIAALLMSLIEQEEFGKRYQMQIVKLANLLGEALEDYHFRLAKLDTVYTNTHQLFVLMSAVDAKNYYSNAQKFNISLNLKHKKLFHDDGIRLGTQEISRYDWRDTEIAQLSKLLYLLQDPLNSQKEILKLRNLLIQKKIPQFEYECIAIK